MRQPDDIFRTALVCALLVLGSGHRAWGQQKQPGQDLGPPTSSTEVIGDIPVDLRGTWLLVAHGTLVEGRVRNSVELYDIERKDGTLDVQLLVRDLPPPMQQKIADSNGQRVDWAPSEDEIAELRRNVDRLKPGDPMRFVKHTIRVIGPSGYESALRGEDSGLVKDSILVLDLEHAFRPNLNEPGGQLIVDKALLIVRKAEPTLLEGEQARLLLASGLAPIPIRMKGPFSMYRLRGPEEGPPAGQSLGARFATFFSNLFRGCR